MLNFIVNSFTAISYAYAIIPKTKIIMTLDRHIRVDTTENTKPKDKWLNTVNV